MTNGEIVFNENNEPIGIYAMISNSVIPFKGISNKKYILESTYNGHIGGVFEDKVDALIELLNSISHITGYEIKEKAVW